MSAEAREDKLPEFIRIPEYLFHQLAELLPLIKKTIPIDNTIAITDTKKYLRALPFGNKTKSGLDGKPLRDGDPIRDAMSRNETTFHVLDKKVFGVAFKTACTPIYDEDGKLLGGLGIGISLDNQEKLQQMAEQLSDMYEKILSAADELSRSAVELSSIVDTLVRVQEEMTEQFRSTDKILGMIHSVAETTKLLGLNAAIEAARAGEHGRGFSVVAQEIRNLADESTSSVKRIRDMLAEVKGKVERLNDTVEQVTRISGQQTAISQEVTASIQELKTVVHDIENVAKVV